MTYEKRYEVLEAAAAWMRVCEKAGVEANCKCDGAIRACLTQAFYERYNYEFPLALLEGKEVWVGSELYDRGIKVRITDAHRMCDFSNCSWSPPKPKTVMVELAVEDAEKMSRDANERLAGTYAYDRVGLACKKALENLK